MEVAAGSGSLGGCGRREPSRVSRQRQREACPDSRRAVLLEHRQRLAETLAAFESGLLSDLGNEPTTAQRALVESTRTALGVCLLASAYLSQGSLDKFKRNRWIMSTLATYLNTLRLNLTTLGLERRTKSAMTLDAVLDDIAQKRGNNA